ncbi:CAAD domain-containing protein [Chlorogloeopsis sp. ULAP02]|uniref:CAAD domain-containing protein n=1 Tax=Chlorogloeopsis sp. ULAP02 TaxID=3107926 RepID=UPI0031358589
MEAEKIQYGEIASPSDVAAIEGTDTQNLPILPPAQSPENQWQQINRIIADFFEKFPEYLEKFFNTYKQPLFSLGWVLVALVSVKVILAMLDAVNDIPLAQPLFELIGIGYASWFTFRYLLKTSTRRELVAEIDLVKKQILG